MTFPHAEREEYMTFPHAEREEYMTFPHAEREEYMTFPHAEREEYMTFPHAEREEYMTFPHAEREEYMTFPHAEREEYVARPFAYHEGPYSMEPGSFWLLMIIAIVSFALSFIGAAVGLILGHVRLPLLIRYLGSPVAGAAMNSLISGVGALAGSVRHVREGRISWPALAMMGIPSMGGAIVAINLIVHVKHFWSYLLIGAMLVVSGFHLIRKKVIDPPPGKNSRSRQMTIEVIIGFGLGALAAITGLMLGSLRLPMMIKYLRMDPKKAIGTNMAVGCLTGLTAAAASYLKGAFPLDARVFAVVGSTTVLGGYMGGWLTGRLSQQTVQKVAGHFIAYTGVILIVQGTGMTRKKPLEVTPVIVDYPEYEDDWSWWDEDDGMSDKEDGTAEEDI